MRPCRLANLAPSINEPTYPPGGDHRAPDRPGGAPMIPSSP